MKHSLQSSIFIVAPSLTSSSAIATEKVNIGVPPWTEAQAMDQGKGDIGVHPDVWLPNQDTAHLEKSALFNSFVGRRLAICLNR